MCAPSAATAVKVPDGALVRSPALRPQQWIVPVLRRAQVWEPPALTAVNVVVGAGGSVGSGSGVCGLTMGGGVRPPQQETPRSRIAQLWRVPAATAR